MDAFGCRFGIEGGPDEIAKLVARGPAVALRHAGGSLADDPPAGEPREAAVARANPRSPGRRRAPGPWNDPADLTVWPNRTSRSNSDPWLGEHHDQIKRMRPRVLLINFSNEHSIEQLQFLGRRIIQCVAEGSRYHGYVEHQGAGVPGVSGSSLSTDR